MTSSPKSVTRTTTVTNYRTGVSTSKSTTVSGNKTTVTKTTTIGTAPKVSSPKGATSKKAAKTPAKSAAITVLGEKWLLGPNDDGWTMCGAVAVANHLLAVTGLEASNAAIEGLYRAAGGIGDSGAPMEFLFAAAASTGLAGCRLASWSPGARVAGASVALMLLPDIPGAHAAAITRDGHAVMWGGEIPLACLDALILDAWSLTWHGEVA